MYWLAVYALIAAVVFAMAGLLILVGFVWFEAEALLRLIASKGKQPVTIGMSVAVPSPLTNGVSDND